MLTSRSAYFIEYDTSINSVQIPYGVNYLRVLMIGATGGGGVGGAILPAAGAVASLATAEPASRAGEWPTARVPATTTKPPPSGERKHRGSWLHRRWRGGLCHCVYIHGRLHVVEQQHFPVAVERGQGFGANDG